MLDAYGTDDPPHERVDDWRHGEDALSERPPAAAPYHRGALAAQQADPNRLLRALPAAEYDHLIGHLTPTRLRLMQVLIEPNSTISEVYFVREGVVSMLATEQKGGAIEVGTIGNEGLVGVPVLLGDDTMPNRVIAQVEGHAWRMDADVFRRVLEERPAVRRICLRYVAYFLTQVSQSVACNRLHPLEERCARWLLMTHDRVHDEFELTHELLSLMLGVRRAGVTVAMGALQTAGIVRYGRGRITVLDRQGLERASCSCYRITRAAWERLLG